MEFADPRVTERALSKLNGLEIGDKKLRVQRVTDEAGDAYESEDEEAKELSTAVKERPKYAVANQGGSYLHNFYKIDDPYIRAMISIPHFCVLQSRVIQLLNMASPEDLVDDEFYAELMEDVKQETARFGTVEKIEIPRPDIVLF